MAPAAVRIRLAEILKERGLKVADLVKMTGLAYDTVLSYSRGVLGRVDLEVLAKMCGALGVAVEDLLVYEDEEIGP